MGTKLGAKLVMGRTTVHKCEYVVYDTDGSGNYSYCNENCSEQSEFCFEHVLVIANEIEFVPLEDEDV